VSNITPTPTRPGVRWWPALTVLALGAAALSWIWGGERPHVQARNLQSFAVVIIAALLLLIWCLGFSRLRWKTRFGIFGAVVLIGLAAGLLLRIRGVSGDLVPILEWRAAVGERMKDEDKRMNPLPVPEKRSESPAIEGAGWPQFLGPNHDATLAGPKLARDWQASPPQLVWRRAVGPAWSGFAVARGLALTQEQRGPEELVTCYDAATGAPFWVHSDVARYNTTIGGDGPRATPTIDGNRVFTLGATGRLNCLDLATGKPIWSKDIMQDNQGTVPAWGLSVSPLVLGDWVIVNAGGAAQRSLVAYRKETGAFAWGGGTDRAGYSSPTLHELGGVRQILIFNHSSVAGHSAETGRLLWSYPWPASHVHVANPVSVASDRIVVSSGYGNAAEMLQLLPGTNGSWTTHRLWRSAKLKAKMTNFVHRDGCLYGLDDGVLVCLDAATGDQKWRGSRYGHGQMILVGELLLVTAENGEVLLLEAKPDAVRELGRFTAFHAKTWNSPALAGDHLWLRNDQQAACFRLPLAP
jgi:outer membrane protein assembly factor BamB